MNENIDKPAICYETDLDESFLVGTKEELSNFANTILQLLGESFESLDYHGVIAKQPKSNSSLSEPMSEVVLDGLLIVKSKDDRRKLINEIRNNCGIEPIDWKGHDEWQTSDT